MQFSLCKTCCSEQFPDCKTEFKNINLSHYSHFLKPSHRTNTKVLYENIHIQLPGLVLSCGNTVMWDNPQEESDNIGISQKVQYRLIKWQSSSNISVQEE